MYRSAGFLILAVTIEVLILLHQPRSIGKLSFLNLFGGACYLHEAVLLQAVRVLQPDYRPAHVALIAR